MFAFLLGLALSLFQLTAADWVDVFDAAATPEDLRAPLVSIAWCESRHYPDAVNPSGPYLGLYQISPMWFEYAGEDLGGWPDPVLQTRVASAIVQYDRDRGYSDFAQWECQPD